MRMRLDQIVEGVVSAEMAGDPGLEITGLAYDSRKVVEGGLFFCVTGMESDGHDFAAAAVEAGAHALVCERPTGLGVTEVLVPDTRNAMAPVAAAFNGHPTRDLKVAGITGTNGKTTTAFLLHDILEAAGIHCGLMGTVKQLVGGVEEPVVRTTPESVDLQATFRRMEDAGDEACVIEASSHALVLRRCDSIDFDLAVFTNLTQDHLDFHTDMEDYFAAKRLLFEAGPGTSVVNIDDPYGQRLAAEFDADHLFGRRRGRRLFGFRHQLRRRRGRLLGRVRARSRSPSAPACRAASTSPTRWRPWPGRSPSGSNRPRRSLPSPRPAGCRDVSSRSTKARRSPCSSTTRIRRTRSRTCCAPRGTSRRAA